MTNVKLEQRLLHEDWKDEADAILSAIRASTRRRALRHHCRVVLFEITGDRSLHVNVTHQRSTATPVGWVGPGVTADGFVHNRRFDFTESDRIAGHIQAMVYAAASGDVVSRH